MERFKDLQNPVSVDFIPTDVKFPKYVLQGTLGKAEAEEMAARFLEFWQENSEWKAVSLQAVAERLDEQAQNLNETNKEVFTLLLLDAYRIDGGSSFVKIGLNYLYTNGYIVAQRYEDGENVAVYIAPTDKLLIAISGFVQ